MRQFYFIYIQKGGTCMEEDKQELDEEEVEKKDRRWRKNKR